MCIVLPVNHPSVTTTDAISIVSKLIILFFGAFQVRTLRRHTRQDRMGVSSASRYDPYRSVS